jgi:flagellin
LLTGSLGVSTTNGTNITQLAQTSATKNGTLNLTADATLATQAKATLTITAGVTTAKTGGTLDITANGSTYNVGFTAGQSLSDIAQNISNTVKGYTATFDSTAHTLVLNSTDANVNQSVLIKEETAKSLDGTADFSSATTATGTNASGLTAAGTAFSYNGNQVTVTSGNFTGLSFTLAQNTAGGATASTNGSSITVAGALQLQIGAKQGQTMSININAMDSQNLGVAGLDVTTQNGAEDAISKLDNAIKSVSGERAKLGAYSNRLDNTINNLNTSSQNTSDAQSRIADVDMAGEMMNQSKASVLAQAAQAMLAQANQQPQQVLQLLRG